MNQNDINTNDINLNTQNELNLNGLKTDRKLTFHPDVKNDTTETNNETKLQSGPELFEELEYLIVERENPYVDIPKTYLTDTLKEILKFIYSVVLFAGIAT